MFDSGQMVPRSVMIGALLATSSVVSGADTPPAAHYTLDPAKSALDFQFLQAGAQNKGKFRKFGVTIDPPGGTSTGGKLDVVVEIASLDTGDKERDDTLRSAELFDAAEYPQAHFTATQITQTGSGFDAAGKLTLRGVTRDQHVPFTLRTAREQNQPVAYLTGKTVIKRLDFGVGQGDWKSTEWVGNEVTVSYSLRLVASSAH